MPTPVDIVVARLAKFNSGEPYQTIRADAETIVEVIKAEYGITPRAKPAAA